MEGIKRWGPGPRGTRRAECGSARLLTSEGRREMGLSIALKMICGKLFSPVVLSSVINNAPRYVHSPIRYACLYPKMKSEKKEKIPPCGVKMYQPVRQHPSLSSKRRQNYYMSLSFSSVQCFNPIDILVSTRKASLGSRLPSHLQIPLPILQALKDLLPLFCKLRLPGRSYTTFKEPGFPFHMVLLPLLGLFSLLLFNLLLGLCGFGELFRDDGRGDTRPEAQGFDFELLGFGWDYLWVDGERYEVD